VIQKYLTEPWKKLLVEVSILRVATVRQFLQRNIGIVHPAVSAILTEIAGGLLE
jgi:hypothetical protein